MQKQASQIGASRALALCQCFIGAAQYFQGRFQDAIGNLNLARDLYAKLDAAAGEAMALQRLAVVETALGRLQEAERHVQEGLALAEQALMKPHCLVRLYATLGKNRLEAVDYKGVLSAVEAGLAVEEKHGLCITCNVMLYPVATMGYALNGNMQTARLYADKAEKSAQLYGSHFFLGLAHQANGMLHGLIEEWKPAFQFLESARQEFQAISEDYEIARTDLFQAFLRMRKGKTVDLLKATRLVSKALPVFVSLGAEALAAQARSALKQMQAL